MVSYQTLFERLGVEPDADDEAVHAAFAAWLVRCKGDSEAIPRDVARAYEFLAVPTNRQHYRDLLEACESGQPLEFAPDQNGSLARLCDLTEIIAYPDLHRKNTFHFRRPDQDPPNWLQAPIEPKVVVRDASSFLWRFLTFRLFRGASPRRKLGLALVYAVVMVALAGSLEWAFKGRDNSRFAAIAVGPSPLAIEQARHRALEQSILAKHREASTIFKLMDDRTAKLRSDFKQLVGLEWEQADASGVQKPRALDLAIIRHDSVREAWTNLLASRIPQDELESRRKVVDAIGRNAGSGTFRAEDEEALKQVIDWGQGRGTQLQSQARNIEHLRVMLAAETFEMAGKEERSAP
ncbi:hypothetical protein RAS2_18530 [Phycisphaerae bacterium RAS2]|nr:hypothetical protein RAS2_18530 [Phycisphaerae bacterium RAS2]